MTRLVLAKRWVAAAGGLMLALIVAIAVSPGMRWRTAVGWRKLTGGLPDVGWIELKEMTQPKGVFHLEPLARGASPFVVIKNPYTTKADQAAGQGVFQTRCAGCHGPMGKGGVGPELTSPTPRAGHSDWSLYRLIRRGIPGTPMTARDDDSRTIWQLVGYIQNLRLGNMADLTPARVLPDPPFIPATKERLATHGPTTETWLTYSGNYQGWRHSSLMEIDETNVRDLRLLWTYQTRAQSSLESTPLVLGGWFYFTEPNSNRVIALDAEDGREIWTYSPVLPGTDLRICCEGVNRGLAAKDDILYLGTVDARLIALEARTGNVLWESRVAAYQDGYSITSAPLVVEGKVIVGVAGGEYGIRGFLDCYDAQTGERLWRFYTIPAPGEPGSETWTGDAWRTGGGPTWVTGTYDPGLRIVYWGVGNPGPDYNGDSRPGDNLYTSSIIALNVDSGKLAWHFQFTPHDEHDWDANQIPMLIDATIEGQNRRLLVQATKNGYYYVLDRVTGEFIRGVPFALQTWAHGLDSTGRPVRRPDTRPTPQGTLVAPASSGATNWMPPSYSPVTRFVYIQSRDEAQLFFKEEQEYERGGRYMGGSARNPSVGRPITAVRALDAVSGNLRWEYRFSDELSPNQTYSIGGILTTASNIVFTGAGREFVALDARSGTRLWRILTGRVKAGPITWASRGRQRVSIAAGQSILTFGLR
jgi:alcohol dehydrogenase (cytochrome c)